MGACRVWEAPKPTPVRELKPGLHVERKVDDFYQESSPRGSSFLSTDEAA